MAIEPLVCLIGIQPFAQLTPLLHFARDSKRGSRRIAIGLYGPAHPPPFTLHGAL